MDYKQGEFKLGMVQWTGPGSGFYIATSTGAPLLTLSFQTEDDAREARQTLETILDKAIAISIPGFPPASPLAPVAEA